MIQENWEEVTVEGDFWKPQPNDELIGQYVEKEENYGPNRSNVYHILKDDGIMIKAWGSTLLDSRFESISIGERVRIVFLGDKPAPRRGEGKTFKDYKLFHSGAKHEENKIPDSGIPVIEQ